MTVGYVLTWDGTASSALPELVVQRVRRNMIGAVRDARIDMPGRDGAYLFPERRGNRSITATCQVLPGDIPSRHQAVVDVADWYDRTGYRRLIISDQPGVFWNASPASDPDPDEWRLQGKFSLAWTAEPYAYDLVPTEECVLGTASAAPQSFIIADTIDALPVVEVTARGGAMENGFTLTTNGQALTFSGAVNQDASVTISSLNSTVLSGLNADIELTGAFISGSVFPGDVSGVFPTLTPGLNTWTLEWAGTATTADVCFTWRRRYR